MKTAVLNGNFGQQIVLTVEPRKYNFLMELLRSFSFVKIAQKEEKKDDGYTREQVIVEMKQVAKDVKLINAGKLKGRPAEELLKEL